MRFALGLALVVGSVAVSRGYWWLAMGIPGVPLVGVKS